MKGDTMPALQVRDCPAPLYEELRQCAAEQDRSIAQQTLYVLRRYLRWYNAVGKYEAQRADIENSPFAEATGAVPRIVQVSWEEQERQARIHKRKALFARMEEHWKDREDPLRDVDFAETIREMREERTDHILSCVEGFEVGEEQ